jgi:HEAT repeat protein
LTKRVAALSDPGDLRRALFLREWRDQDQTPQVAEVDRAARHEIAKRLEQALRRGMTSGDATHRLAAATMLGAIGIGVPEIDGNSSAFARPLAADLARLVNDKNADVQAAAARALGKINPDAKVATEALASLLQTNELGPRRAAAGALSNLIQQSIVLRRVQVQYAPRDVSSPGEVIEMGAAVVPLAARGLGDPDPEVRRSSSEAMRQAVIALGDFLPSPQGMGAARALGMSLRNDAQPAEDLESAVRPLVRALADHAPALTPALNDSNPAVCLAANQAWEAMAGARLRLMRPLGAPAEGEPVPEAGADQSQRADPFVKALGGAVTALGKNLTHSDVRVQLASLYVLETLGSAAAPVAEAVVKALRDPSPFVRWGAVRTLGKMAPVEWNKAVPGLAGLLDDENSDVRYTAVVALARYGPAAKAAVQPLVGVVNHGDAKMRESAICALVAIGSEARSAVPALATALSDPEVQIRRAAALALVKLRPHAPATVDALRKALNDPDGDVREAAGDALLAGK